ncbi:MAG TPA: peptidyl-prolyl cis-trans isomerase [Candidatus Methylomirabilis sp.]|nr:peptidyl-prolyl cis-trans isomerase [Candidatus Methylomirabilis sp.]
MGRSVGPRMAKGIAPLRLLLGMGAVVLVAIAAVGIWFTTSGAWRGWRTVASVDGNRITRAELDDHLALLSKQGRLRLDPQADPARRKEVERTVLDDLITRKLLQSEAERLRVKVEPGEEDVVFGQTHGGATGESKLAEMAKRTGQDIQRMREDVRRQLLVTRLAEKVTEGVSVSDEDVAKYYETHPETSTSPAMAQLRLLIVETRGKAEQLRQQILSGESFEALVRQHSKGGYRERGGDMGWVDLRLLPQSIATAVAAIPQKGITPVVEAQGRYYIVRVEGRQAPRRIPLAEVKDQLAKTLLAERKRATFADWLQERRRNAKIEIYP